MSRDWTFSSSILDQYFANHVVLNYRKGQMVFPQGSPADVMYWLKRGIVEIQRSNRDGARFILRLAGPGELMGFADVIDEKSEPVQAFGARARTNCEVVLLTREHVIRVLESLTPAQAAQLMIQLNRSWAAESTHLVDFLMFDCRERVKLALIDLARRFGARDERGTVVFTELTHQDISDMVGFSRAMTSRILGELISEGAIAVHDGHYLVPNGSELAILINLQIPAEKKQSSTAPRIFKGVSKLAAPPRIANSVSNHARPIRGN